MAALPPRLRSELTNRTDGGQISGFSPTPSTHERSLPALPTARSDHKIASGANPLSPVGRHGQPALDTTGPADPRPSGLGMAPIEPPNPMVASSLARCVAFDPTNQARGHRMPKAIHRDALEANLVTKTCGLHVADKTTDGPAARPSPEWPTNTPPMPSLKAPRFDWAVHTWQPRHRPCRAR